MFNISANQNNFVVSFSPSSEGDIAGYVIHAVPSSQLVGGDFTPDATNLINIGPETSFSYNVPSESTWYVKAAAFDTFEDINAVNFSQLNYSAMNSIELPMFKGDWVVSTNYVKGDEVMYDGSSWAALQSHLASSSNKPPALPTTTNAWWGLKSARGETPPAYVRVTGTQTFKYLAGEPTPTTDMVGLQAKIFGVDNPTYDWKFWSQTTGWTSFTTGNGGVTFQLYHDDSAWEGEDYLQIRCMVGELYDEMAVAKLRDGLSYTVILTNESQAIPCDSSGTPLEGTLGVNGVKSTVMAWKGTTPLTAVADGVNFRTI